MMGQHIGGEEIGSADDQMAPVQIAQLADLGGQLILRGHDLLNGVDVELSGLRQANGQAGTVKELHPDLLLHLFDAGAEGRLGNKQIFGRAGEAAFPIDFVDIEQCILHGGLTFGRYSEKLLEIYN